LWSNCEVLRWRLRAAGWEEAGAASRRLWARSGHAFVACFRELAGLRCLRATWARCSPHCRSRQGGRH